MTVETTVSAEDLTARRLALTYAVDGGQKRLPRLTSGHRGALASDTDWKYCRPPDWAAIVLPPCSPINFHRASEVVFLQYSVPSVSIQLLRHRVLFSFNYFFIIRPSRFLFRQRGLVDLRKFPHERIIISNATNPSIFAAVSRAHSRLLVHPSSEFFYL